MAHEYAILGVNCTFIYRKPLNPGQCLYLGNLCILMLGTLDPCFSLVLLAIPLLDLLPLTFLCHCVVNITIASSLKHNLKILPLHREFDLFEFLVRMTIFDFHY